MHGPEISAAEALYLLDLAEMASRAQDLPELAESFLHGLARLIQTPAAILYLEAPASAGPFLLSDGAPARSGAHRQESMRRSI